MNAIHVLTLGAPNLDFKLAAGGTCVVGTSYVSGASCTVAYSFTPAYPGQRRGAITLTNGSGALLGVSYLAGIGNGPLAVFTSDPQVSTVSNAFSTPHAVVVDGNGNIFVSDTAVNKVIEIPASTGTVVPVAVANGNFNNPTGIAVDGAGNGFIADTGNTAIKEIIAADGYITVNTLPVPNGTFTSPYAVAADGSGNVFVVDASSNAVTEILASGGYTTVNTLAVSNGNWNAPQAIAVDGANNLFVADTNHGLVKKILAPGYTAVQAVGSGFAQVVPNARGIRYGWVLLPMLALGGLRKRRSRMQRTWALLLGVFVFGISGCGSGGYFGAAPSSYVITVTATSGMLHH